MFPELASGRNLMHQKLGYGRFVDLAARDDFGGKNQRFPFLHKCKSYLKNVLALRTPYLSGLSFEVFDVQICASVAERLMLGMGRDRDGESRTA